MPVNPSSVAVQGFGFAGLAVATQGFLFDEVLEPFVDVPVLSPPTILDRPGPRRFGGDVSATAARGRVLPQRQQRVARTTATKGTAPLGAAAAVMSSERSMVRASPGVQTTPATKGTAPLGASTPKPGTTKRVAAPQTARPRVVESYGKRRLVVKNR